MAARYNLPGVYYEAQDIPRLRPDLIRTDITGFVGFADRGPFNRATKIESWDQFQSRFGGPVREALLGYAVRSFFDNGGQTCWVVRAGSDAGQVPAEGRLAIPNWPGKMLRIRARDPGKAGEEIRVEIQPRPDRRFSLLVFRTRHSDSVANVERERWLDLTVDEHPAEQQLLHGAEQGGFVLGMPEVARRASSRFVTDVLDDVNGGSALIAATVEVGFAPRPARAVVLKHSDWSTARPLRGERFKVEDLTGENSPDYERRGLRALEERPEVSLVAIPDLVWHEPVEPEDARPRPCAESLIKVDAFAPRSENRQAFEMDAIFRAQRRLIHHCEMLRDRFALLDPPHPLALEEIVRIYGRDEGGYGLRSSYAAVYAPWLYVQNAPGSSPIVHAVPPSGVMAGLVARVDLDVGVHKAPANERVLRVQGVDRVLDEAARAMLHEASVNAIGPVSGRGIRVLGARTLFPRDAPEWRYINVRRLFAMVEDEVQKLGQEIVFESNARTLQSDVERAVRTLLDRMWRRGMLDGASADEAYAVACDPTTNTPSEVEQGKLVCVIGMKAPQPAEFVIVRVGISLEESPQVANG